MSTAAFSLVSKKIKDALQAVLLDAGLTANVVLKDPGSVTNGDVSLWHYQVGLDEFSRNNPIPSLTTRDPAASPRTLSRLPPLGVNLYYLITPVLGSLESDQDALATIMLALHERALMSVSQLDAEVNEQVRISYLPDTLDDRLKLWESIGKPYRLSVCYLVRTVRLVSKETIQVAPIISTTAGLAATSIATE